MQQPPAQYPTTIPADYVPSTVKQPTPDAATNLGSFVQPEGGAPAAAPTNSFYAQKDTLQAAPQPLRQPPPSREPYSYTEPAAVPSRTTDPGVPPTSSYAGLSLDEQPPPPAKVQPPRRDPDPAVATNGAVGEQAWFNTARTWGQGGPEATSENRIPALDPNSFDPVSALQEKGLARQTQDGHLTDGMPPPKPTYERSAIPSTQEISRTIQSWMGGPTEDRTYHEFHPGDQIFWADQLKTSEADAMQLRARNDRLRAEIDAIKARNKMRQSNAEEREKARRQWFVRDEEDQVAVVSESGAIHWMPISLKRHLQAVGVASPEELPVMDCEGKLICTDNGDQKYRWSYTKPPPYWVLPPADDLQLQEQSKIQPLDRPYTFGLAGTEKQRAEWKEEDDFEDVLNTNLLTGERTASVHI